MLEEELQKLKDAYEEYMNSIISINVGKVREFVIDDYITHKIKRIDEHTWEYICPCCNGRRLSMGKLGLEDTGVNEKMCPKCKKWYGCVCE